MYVKLSASDYRRLPLVQGGMEIRCTVNFRMPSTLKNAQLAEPWPNGLTLHILKKKNSRPDF